MLRMSLTILIYGTTRFIDGIPFAMGLYYILKGIFAQENSFSHANVAAALKVYVSYESLVCWLENQTCYLI